VKFKTGPAAGVKLKQKRNEEPKFDLEGTE
jgi:hypothetical protein